MTESEQKPKNAILRFFSNPLVGIIGSIASILGLVFCFYFYFQSKEKPELMFYVYPLKTTIVKSGEVSKLSVRYEDKEIATDVTSVQIAFWNNGKKPIKREDILEPIKIYTEKENPIIEAKLSKTSRELTKIILNREEINRGVLKVEWKILEQNDAGLIQIVYSGNPDVILKVDGSLEGQKNVTLLSEKVASQYEQWKSQKLIMKIFGLVSLLFGIIILGTDLYFLIIERNQEMVPLIPSIILLVIGIYITFFYFTVSPPLF